MTPLPYSRSNPHERTAEAWKRRRMAFMATAPMNRTLTGEFLSGAWTLFWSTTAGRKHPDEGLLLRTKDYAEYCAVLLGLTVPAKASGRRATA